MNRSLRTLRFAQMNFLMIIGMSWLLVHAHSFSWNPLSPTATTTTTTTNHCKSFHTRSLQPRHRRRRQHHSFVDEVRLRSTTTSLVSSAVDVVHLQYTEITAAAAASPSVAPTPPHYHAREAPPVIFLHGLLGNKKNFISLGTALAAQLETQRRILAVDLRNHGENNHDWRDSMGHDEMALDVIALLDRLQFSQVIVVGHSMGGKVAQAMALLHPERVAGLIVLDMAPVSYIHHDKGGEYDSNWKTIRDILQVLTSVPFEPGMTKRDVDVFLRPHISDPAIRAFCLTNLEMTTTAATPTAAKTTIPRWKIPLFKIAQQLDRLAAFDLQPSLASSSTRTTPISQSSHSSSQSSLVYQGDAFFITGGQSKFVRSVHLPVIQQYFPNHMVSTIRGAGHWVHAEAPDETIALIKRYLDRSRTNS